MNYVHKIYKVIQKGTRLMTYQDYFFNPTTQQRHQLLLDALTLSGRPEDYENILDLLSPPPDISHYAEPNSLRNIRIGIIGAGLAGLSAAYELRKLGAAITLFDAQQDRVGGRVYTLYFDDAKQYYGEFGALRIPVSHETTWHYIDLFNLSTQSLTSPQSNNFIYAHQTRIRRDLSGQTITQKLYPKYALTEQEIKTPWPELRNYALETMLNSLSPEQRTEILKILPQYSNEYASITKLSNRQVFEQLALSQGAISLLSAVEPLTGSLLNVSHDEIMSSSYSLDFANVYRIQGGMAYLPSAFYNSLMNASPPENTLPPHFLGKVDIRLGQSVKGISKSLDRKEVILHYSQSGGCEASQPFDYIVCAIPFSTLRTIEITPFFSNQKMQAIKELNYLDAQKTLFFCRKRFWEENEPYGNINGGISFTDLPIQSILYPTDHILSDSAKPYAFNEPGVLTASYNLGQDAVRLSNQNIFHRLNLIKENVERVHGLPSRYLNALLTSYKTVHWNTQHWSRGAFAMNDPGQKVNFSFAALKPEYNNRIFFAGEHVSAKQGWMQGSLYTGKAAANEIAQHSQS
jgi:monoamine oxidase